MIHNSIQIGKLTFLYITVSSRSQQNVEQNRDLYIKNISRVDCHGTANTIAGFQFGGTGPQSDRTARFFSMDEMFGLSYFLVQTCKTVVMSHEPVVTMHLQFREC